MKKSKFLQNSKDMLSRSFNPSKCKISLRLAGSRLKLLRNKKEVQVKQMKREIAQLLESGQDLTARIRVEHVIREEKMMAAYDLLEIYSELIVARLPIIESQKNCPIDLKEAIASVVFASPRCGDVPELLDVRKHFAAKYGKDFITAAIELRPQCGASRMLVEKLSASAPDVQTKTKILSAIAEEHNVKWDDKPFEETNAVPPSDLLNGPGTLGKESKPYVETSHAQAPPSNNEMYSSPMNFSRQDFRTSIEAGKLASGQNSGVSEMYQPEARPPGDERWNLEFKDAASAAQAAAESAERASIAAKAAAEHASRDKIMRQNSSESHESDSSILEDDGPQMHQNSQFPQEPVKKSSSEQVLLHNEKINEIKPNNPKTAANHGVSEEYSPSVSVEESKASIENDRYSRKNALEEVSKDEMGSGKDQSLKYEAEIENVVFDRDDYIEEERIGKQPSISRSGSHSSISENLNIFSDTKDKILEDNAENPFALGIDKGQFHGEASQTSSHKPASQFFDRYDSYGDDQGFDNKGHIHGEASQTSSNEPASQFDRYDSYGDDHGFDLGPSYDEPESEFHMPSFRQESPERLPVVTDSWSPQSSSSKIVNSTSSSLFFARENSSNDFPENLTSQNGSELDNFAPVTFDDSESDEEMKTKHNGMEDTRDLRHEHNKSEESVISQLKDKGKSVESPFEESQLELNDTGNESGPEMEQRLNFDKLTGGIRHKKGYNRPSFLKNRLDKSLSVRKENDETTEMVTILDHKKSTRETPNRHSISDSDSSEEEAFLQKSSDEDDILYTYGAGKDVQTKSSLRASTSIFGSDNSDLDEDPPKESVTRKSNLLGGISRRTKGSHSNTGMNKKPSSYISENPKTSESQITNSNKCENYDHPTSENVDYPCNNPETHELVKATNSRTEESKILQKSSEIEEPSVSSENPKTSSSNEDESTRKASHVHPKLPDYDSLLQSLRMRRS